MGKMYTWRQLVCRHIFCTLFKLLLLLAAIWALQETTNGVDYVSMMSLYYWLPIMCAAVLWGLCRDISYFVMLLRHRDLTGNRKTVRALYPKKLKVFLKIPPVLLSLVFVFVTYSEAYFGFFHQNTKSQELLQRFALENYTDYTYVESTPTFHWGGDEYEFYSVYMLNHTASYRDGKALSETQEPPENTGSVSVVYMDNCPQWLMEREYAEQRDARAESLYHVPDHSWESVQMVNTQHPLQGETYTGFWKQIPTLSGTSYSVTLLGENRYLDVWVTTNNGALDLQKLLEDAALVMQAE